jgi:sulfane dehydrogenase subunit SoxC
LQEAGVRPNAAWIVAEGADTAGMTRSVPIGKALDDAVLGLFPERREAPA